MDGGAFWLIYYWYQGRGRVTAGEYRAAVIRALDSAWQNRSDEALVRFTTMDDGPEGEAELQEFIRQFVELLPPYLPS